MTWHAKWAVALAMLAAAGGAALQAAVTSDWSQKPAQALLFAFLIGPPLFLVITVWRRRTHLARSRVLFWVAAVVAVGGLGALGFACYRHHTDAEFRRTPNMFGVLVPLVQWGAILATWLWLVIQEGREKREQKKQTQSA